MFFKKKKTLAEMTLPSNKSSTQLSETFFFLDCNITTKCVDKLAEKKLIEKR